MPSLNPQAASTAIGRVRYIPWRRIGAWSCLGCGGCCHLGVFLRPYEYARLTKVYGQNAMQIDSVGNPCLRKVSGRCVFQDRYGLCMLQPFGMKPLACKVWPFSVHVEAKHNSAEALFVYEGKDYYVYVDMVYPCRGLGEGTAENLYSAISEIIEMQSNPVKQQIHSTSILSSVDRTPLARAVRLINPLPGLG